MGPDHRRSCSRGARGRGAPAVIGQHEPLSRLRKRSRRGTVHHPAAPPITAVVEVRIPPRAPRLDGPNALVTAFPESTLAPPRWSSCRAASFCQPLGLRLRGFEPPPAAGWSLSRWWLTGYAGIGRAARRALLGSESRASGTRFRGGSPRSWGSGTGTRRLPCSWPPRPPPRPPGPPGG